MALFDNFPWTNVHQLNLNWLLQTVKKLKEEWEGFGGKVTASAVQGATTDVTLTGDLESGLNFAFTLEKGDQGEQGPEGVSVTNIRMSQAYRLIFDMSDGSIITPGQSVKGPQGDGLKILDTFISLAALQSVHPTGQPGDMYLVGTSPNFTLYLWSEDDNGWADGGPLSSPGASNTTPAMNGNAAVGSETSYARGDHVHPSDTSKQNKLISGTNIKTVNGQSLLGSGDLALPTLENVYPIGSLYFNRSSNSDPSVLLGFGTWQALENMFLIGASQSYPLGSTGGERSHVLTANEMPEHNHSLTQLKRQTGTGTRYGLNPANERYYQDIAMQIPVTPGFTGLSYTTDDAGYGYAHNNIPPYIAVYIWQRIA